jgi:uracil-DNA glycosylase
MTHPRAHHSDIDGAATLAELAEEAASCERCRLYENATQTVFGEGHAGAAMMLVGEQPGDQEDIQGRPFVGPAGHILDNALAEAGLERAALYITNAVKHFKNEPRGKRRLHKRPDRAEIDACHGWLEREIALVNPVLIVALGATAAQALCGRAVVIGKTRGRMVHFAGGRPGLVTIHPSAVLRMRDDESRREAFATLAADLRTAKELLRALQEPSNHS